MSKKNGIQKDESLTASLSAWDRLMLKSKIVPEGVGSFQEALVVMEIHERIEFSDEENEALDMKQTQDGIQWKEIPAKEVTFDPEELRITKMGFQRLRNDPVQKDQRYFRLIGQFFDRDTRRALLESMREKEHSA